MTATAAPSAAAVTALLAEERPLRWLFTGDSITHGALHTAGERDYVQLFEERLRWELGRLRDHVIRTAISGRRVPDLVADLDWSVLDYRPDVVSLMFGLNDCATPTPDVAAFADAYRAVLDRVQATGAVVVLHTPNRILSTETPERRANLPAYADAVRMLAAETDALLVDHHAEWAEADEQNAVEYWIDHGCHPNAAGHRVLARSLLRSLGLWDQSSPTGRFYIPQAEYLPA
ncbi:SGNH/GDSL hydrolase family protein [Herbiconiux sp. P17]|uniref:SGNH/GDSL hydrolase family protein n=1 Tax=Herbiconiux wuyangfengii TaxID=3342794 RepID=UPI0035BA0E26